MSSGTVLDRFMRLQAELTTLVSTGKRDPEVVCRALERLVTEPAITVWREITLGTLRSGEAYRRVLKQQDAMLPVGTLRALERLSVARTPTYLDLITASVGELGLEDGVDTHAVLQAARELGLELCPAEVGPALRLQYWEQPREWLTIGMEPIPGKDGTPIVFIVGRVRDTRWLRVQATPPNGWSKHKRFVFVKPKQ